MEKRVDLFKWLNDAGNSEKLRKLFTESIEPQITYLKIEDAMCTFENYIVLNELMPLITFKNRSQFQLTEESYELDKVSRTYIFANVTIKEKIYYQNVENIIFQYQRVDYSGKYLGACLPSIKSITQSFAIEFSDDCWLWGAHYSGYYFINKQLEELKATMNKYNETALSRK
ncbi:MAG: hypothetical protein K0R72_1182 [Clostridia bacterium]|jgi:hypothetical protein|nr:hypothetical protein [Clostridia bacterium]